MPVHNADVAAVFDEMADLLEIEGSNPFRIRAYRNAARTLRDLPREVAAMLDEGEDLTELPGIGEDLAAKIKEVVETGTAAMFEQHRKKVPKTLTELLRIPGIGPKRVKALYHDLGIRTLDQLQKAAQDGLVRSLHGFGGKTERYILDQLKARTGEEKRFQLAIATQYAEALIAFLKESPGVKQVVVAGSYRRAKETIGDLDILVTAASNSPVMNRFVSYPEVEEILAQGTTKASVRLACKLQVDVRVVPEDSYGAALQYFTGSKAHNVTLRQLAQQRGLKLNEYGLFKGDRSVAGATEESVYAAVGLPWIPPELRENRGEFDAARAGRLPALVEVADLKGDLHAHTKATDGRNSIREMAEAARARGLEYLAITDHSRRLTMAKGLDPKQLFEQLEEIDRLNATLSGITLLKGIEVDILEDGSLDLPDEDLCRLDLVVGAVHSHFRLSRQKQTERIMRAMDHPYFTLLAHPSGRLIDERAPYDVDMARIIHHARERGCFLEVNAHPVRLDLTDTDCQMAKEEGVMLSINSDAHSVLDFENLRYGVGQARRGWLEKNDVLNARPLHSLQPLLKRTMR
ncbi:MAG: DNA polymerase/3'-5' exonuclease PolX [Nitrospira sp.]|nr:DNA polymerase/3'-5' exonuclease PolX [Nitrospira sp.]MDH4370592.1 DNA polymerase/3'-5' exonuclease PolX [Nitrospira sp.]MDH5347668.1 DNA polymerase/3'-5' exonuclease PolX [Nitrospira sp.]MDH5498228.1 DNA polymerase/3'-5' exonuclease PolX [Nitrospira sp.]MDH5724267.1 DNA polymerase/3'-5' exonuclease PolX [Nitrospira sp.]